MKAKFNALIALLFAFNILNAQDEKGIFDMSLDELMNMEITSASKKAENIKEVPSSIDVITSKDIERSGATNIMELMREVPGYWGVSTDYMNVDGFIRNTFEGSVLVLLDGTPLLDLMWADFQYGNFEIPLSMIDRIEVIKGSGGTVYGANSATGVISIFSKNPEAQSKIFADLKAAFPGYINMDMGLSKKFSEKFSANAYGKYSYFSGYNQMPQTMDDTYLLKGINGGEDQTIVNRYTEDDNSVNTVAGGLGFTYKASGLFTLSGNLHANGIMHSTYDQFNPPSYSYLVPDANFDPTPRAEDSTYYVSADNRRVVGSVKGEFNFSEKHSLFARISTNSEHAHYSLGGGFSANNSIQDFELQDNIEFGINQLSIGGNFRLVNFNIHDIYSTDAIQFLKNKRNENLKGAFIQDKISLVKDKLSVYLGVKAENFSLLNDKFYLSPMAKMVFSPSDKFTLWGGYTKSYTTPGYNQTGIEYSLFRAATPEVFYNFAYPLVQAGVYDQAYQQAIGAGADDATAQAMAEAFIESTAGLAVIDAVTNQQIAGDAAAFPGHYNAAAINGPNTEPASFSNFEIGLRLQPSEKVYFETNLFYSQFQNSIGNSPALFDKIQASPTRQGENILPSYYGSYIKGSNYGAETIVKYQPIKKLTLEFSHALFVNDQEYQANEDFDVEALSEGQRDLVNEDHPVIPKNIFRAKAYLDLPSEIRLTVSGLYSSAFYNRFGTVESSYDFENQRFDPLVAGSDSQHKTKYGIHDHRAVLNIRIDKYLAAQKLNVFVFANDLLSAPFIESVNQLQTAYPRQVGRMAGLGLSFKL